MGACYSAVCCGVSALACIGKVVTITSSRASRLVYFALFTISMVVAWMSGSYGHYYTSQAIDDGCGSDETCKNNSSVFRITLGNTLFHSLMFFLVYGVQSSSVISAIAIILLFNIIIIKLNKKR